jgi:hypothetical protein
MPQGSLWSRRRSQAAELIAPRLPCTWCSRHNGAVTDAQIAAPCPQCGSTAAVHSISELAELAKMQLDKAQQASGGGAPPGYGGGAQPGYAAEPQAGPLPGYAGEPQAGPLPGYAGQPQAGPLPGYAGEPQAGPLSGSWSCGSRDFDAGPISDGIDQAIADVALGAAARFIGRAISRRVQRTVDERVLPALAAQQQAKFRDQEGLLRDQIAIAERYPGLRACMTDKVIFLSGGSRVLPFAGANLMVTLQQADALVAQLREG